MPKNNKSRAPASAAAVHAAVAVPAIPVEPARAAAPVEGQFDDASEDELDHVPEPRATPSADAISHDEKTAPERVLAPPNDDENGDDYTYTHDDYTDDEPYADDDAVFDSADRYANAYAASGDYGVAGAGGVDTRHVLHKLTDKSDRATAEQVLDPRTRMILFKIVNQGLLAEIHGCVSTGKEANVYHAVTASGQHRAIKVYKTSILVFKDRDRYVSGEHRFRHGYARHNPRKMVKVWAEKEMRNLKRLRAAGIPSPEPLLLKLHVLVMDFIGDADGRAAPRLKDANLDAKRAKRAYHSLLRMMWVLFHECRLVHADLSEYNILYHQKQCYIIDVSQSVEHEHPHALEFLRKDCSNVTEFFRKKGVAVLSLRELFDFVTNAALKPAAPAAAAAPTAPAPTATASTGEAVAADAMVAAAENLDAMDVAAPTALASLKCPSTVDEHLAALLEAAEARGKESRNAAKRAQNADMNALQVEEEVFKHAYVPRTLDEVVDMERDMYDVINQGRAHELVYKDLLALPGSSKPEEKEEKKEGKEEKKVAVPAVDKKKGKKGGKKGGKKAALPPLHATAAPVATQSAATLDLLLAPLALHDATVPVGDEVELALSDLDDSDEDEESDGDDALDDGSSEDEDGTHDRPAKAPRGKKHMDKEEKKALKQQTKEAKREKRKTKIPKAVKKRKEKLNKEKSKK
ncbi:atypical/RIO/RIO1 protein kinase [Allomyces macrogynus ATCC 38327]|uniref:Serine/threonine-protein kinase RIO1 n=1 Tax=Allomyces macrogynus (strain ATCC 38327) TaxID=578462 RepID=A0A0L0RZW3_ALLM3|nr:atypical/RIO/RIO1 protein kinase [Allomyces macrogynus ATCC 38327]|eukprot:KNE55685.1 atypical/RIO/RIO1 protein kinase [Allomyces macrogynus ATCC 38327]